MGAALREYIPVLRTPAGRWILPVWNHGDFLGIFVDDPGSCTNQHILCYGKQHRYQDEGGALYIMFCPERLTWEQKQSLVQDIPDGSWRVKVSARKVDMIEKDAEKRRKLMEEERMQGSRR